MEIKSTADFVRMSRGVLAAAGFVRNEIEGVVCWVGGDGARTGQRPVDRPASGRRSIVLLHGVNDQAGTWFTIAPQLTQRFRVIIPDLPGHGESAPESGPLPISLLLDRLQAVMPAEPFVLLGNSLGGWLAMLYTLRHPARVAKLILETSGGLNRPFASPIYATNREEAHVVLRAVHGPRYQPQEWVVDALLARAVDSQMLRMTEVEQHYVDGRLQGIQAQLIWGADDGVLPLTYAHALRQELAGAELHIIEGAAHIPHLQQPGRFLECLTAIC